MKRLAACLLALATLATSTVQAQFVPISVDFAEAPVSYELKTSVGNTPTIRVTFKNSGASTNISSWTPYLKWSKNESAVDGMVTVAGTATSDYAEFVCSTNTFGRATKDGYFAIYLSRSGGNENITVVRGRINIFPSPEVSQQAALATTTLVNWNLLSFTGTPPWTALNYPTDVVVSTWVVASSNLARSAYTIATNSLPLSASNNFYRADNPSGYVAYASVHPAAVLASNALPRSGGLLTGDVDLTNAGLTSLDFAMFDAAPTGAISARRLQWNAARDTLRFGLNSTVNYDLGHQVILYARNADSNTINKGEVVYISGSSGDNATFMRASNDSETRSARTIGIMAETVAQNNFGNIVNQGTVYNLDTSAFPAGAGLYLGAGGTMQTNLPTAPLHGVFLGVVERSHANVGQVYVTIQNYQELRELSDVRLNGQTNLNVLTYISASNRWEARSVSSMETDPFWAAVSNDIHARIVAASNLAYTASTAPVDQTARDWAIGASNLALSASQSSTDLAARAWINTVSGMVVAASYSSTDLTARSWANYASNLASTAIAASTGYALKTWVTAASNLALDAYNKLPSLTVISNSLSAVIANNVLTSNSIVALAVHVSSISNDVVAFTNSSWYAYTNSEFARATALASSNLARSAYQNATNALVIAINASNYMDSFVPTISNSYIVATNARAIALTASNIASVAEVAATSALVRAINASNYVNSLTSMIVYAHGNSITASTWAVAGSNLAASAYLNATQAMPLALIASNLALNANTYATQAHVWAQSGSNLAFSANTFATQAHVWALAASNLALSASRSSTDSAARASIGQISNWVVATSNALPSLLGISNSLALLDAKILNTSNSLPFLGGISNNIVLATNTAAVAYSVATNAAYLAGLKVGSVTNIKSGSPVLIVTNGAGPEVSFGVDLSGYADNLGNHEATQILTMFNYGILFWDNNNATNGFSLEPTQHTNNRSRLSFKQYPEETNIVSVYPWGATNNMVLAYNATSGAYQPATLASIGGSGLGYATGTPVYSISAFSGHGSSGIVVGTVNATTSMYLRGDGIFTNSNLLLLSPPDTDNQNWRQFVSSSIIITNTDPNTDDEYRNGLGFKVSDYTGDFAFLTHDPTIGLWMGFRQQSTNFVVLQMSTNDIGASSQPTNGSYINPAYQQRISIMRGYNNSNEKILNDILDTSWANPTSFTYRSTYDAAITNVNAVRLGGALPSSYLSVSSYQNANTNHIRFLTTTTRPSSPTDSGLHGEVRFDATNIYIYMQAGGTNKWMRIPGSFTW